MLEEDSELYCDTFKATFVMFQTGEKSRDDALEAIKGNLDGFSRDAKMHPTPASHPKKPGILSLVENKTEILYCFMSIRTFNSWSCFVFRQSELNWLLHTIQ